jgi:hypothetical protein
VTSGFYAIQIEREGYFRPGASSVNNTTTAVTDSVNASANLKGLTYWLMQGGIISGRVMDADGRPMAGIPITVLRAGYNTAGTRILSTVGPGPARLSAATNDRGEYRVFWLPPGRYYVRAEITLPSQAAVRGAATGTTTAGYVSTFFPAAPTQAGAVPVTVRGGAESSSTDITLQKPQTYTVSGSMILSDGVTLPATGGRAGVRTVPPSFQFFRHGEIPELSSQRYRGSGAAGRAEQFRISGILPGTYDLLASVGELSGRALVTVVDRDVEGVVVEIFPNIALKANLVLPPDVLGPGQTVGISLGSSTPPFPLATGRASGGSFELTGVPRGEYRASLDPGYMTRGYVADVRQSGRSILNDSRVTVDAAAGPLEVAMRSGGGTIQGTVRGAANGMLRIATLIPEPPRRQSLALYAWAPVINDGSFTFSGVAPGQYKVFAWSTPEGRPYYNEQFLAAYESRGRLVNVAENGSVSGIQLDLIQPD